MFLKIDGKENLVRDARSMAVINTDRNAFECAKKLRQEKTLQKEKLEQLETKVQNIEEKIDLILSLLDKK